MAFYSSRRHQPTFRRVSSKLNATQADPYVTLMFTDGTRLKVHASTDLDVRSR